MQEFVRQFYPNAIESGTFVQRTLDVLKNEYGLHPSQILLAHSICSDDVNAIAYPEEGRQMLGPFNLGGLDGYPFVGLTGMAAFAHHVPDDGAALIFYAPHIGVTAQGELGKILRVGQPAPSSCCGAAVAALQQVWDGVELPASPPDDNYQQYSLVRILQAQRERILAAKYPLQEATEVILEASSERIDHMIRNTSFTGKYIFVVSAVIINGDRDFGSHQELRRFERLDLETKEVVATHTF
ncbi:hypothetical protein [Hymenobacter rubidus]|uniref:hypothetical protein n=1 Tax=Hymenobacter rubidus TaxID=1441626 RepID=UPI00191CEAD8|nr:hypothetical protein [Hymenobacter rubidus]